MPAGHEGLLWLELTSFRGPRDLAEEGLPFFAVAGPVVGDQAPRSLPGVGSTHTRQMRTFANTNERSSINVATKDRSEVTGNRGAPPGHPPISR